jgi:predicted DNA-binding protein (MmcQ/YjbR family)
VSSRSHECRTRLATICGSLPEADTRQGGEHGRHVAYTVRNKTFAYFTDDHHGDGRLALMCKAAPGDQEALVASDAERFFVPPYLGHRGWVGLWLDTRRVDWAEVRELVLDAYRLAAPKRLQRALDELPQQKR